ncbi:hypothetical protein TNCT6_61030 [Streptomyces sp. 6-11-2]|nr:hypothetical protein TNCT6_61030 [Streptomyces sp. 6-11-2]
MYDMGREGKRARRVLVRDDRARAPSRMRAQRGLHLAGLEAVTADHDLLVHLAEGVPLRCTEVHRSTRLHPPWLTGAGRLRETTGKPVGTRSLVRLTGRHR